MLQKAVTLNPTTISRVVENLDDLFEQILDRYPDESFSDYREAKKRHLQNWLVKYYRERDLLYGYENLKINFFVFFSK
jgi:hypothetical protein